MIGRVVEGDLLGLVDRIKSIYDGYYVFLDYEKGEYQLHDRYANPSKLLSFGDRLDERAYVKTLYTRAENVKSVVSDLERVNRKAGYV